MYTSLSKKVVLVTGGTKGIGHAIAERFQSEGSTVVSIARNRDSINTGDISFFKCDVSSEVQVVKTISEIRKTHGTIDILVNNAAIEKYAPLDKTSTEMWDEIMNVNVKGAYFVSREVLPDMIKKGKGVIINVASVQSYAVSKNACAYVTSKHALISLTKSIAVDYAPFIRSIAVCPATIETPLTEWAASIEVGSEKEKIMRKYNEWGTAHALGRIGKPEEVANLVVFLASDEASFITGSCYLVDGGMLSMIPISTPEVSH